MTDSALGRPSEVRVVPSIGSTATSTSGGRPGPPCSPLYRMGPRFVRLALVLFTLLAVGALGAGVYASGEGADVFGVATTTTVPPTTKPPATTTTTLKPSPSPSPSPTVSATDTVDPALTADE